MASDHNDTVVDAEDPLSGNDDEDRIGTISFLATFAYCKRSICTGLEFNHLGMLYRFSRRFILPTV